MNEKTVVSMTNTATQRVATMIAAKEKSLMLERFEIQIKNLFKYKYEKIYNELNLILKKIELLKFL